MGRPTGELLPREPIAIVRLDDLSSAVDLARALVAGGIRALEFTLTNAKAPAAIGRVRAELGGSALVGAGTVLDTQGAQTSILAGAQFLVTPTYQPEVIECGLQDGVPVVSGALTPTEILRAWESGATLVKVFPARTFGPAYIKDVLAPLPDLRLVPTGGVSPDNCAAFLDAGAYTVAVGSSLVDEDMITRGDWDALSHLASEYVRACAPDPRG
jgi:2-dehydro-3-deoxyphosphogluconate aldolase/(4S)-4-hydroxy-2-oxoglutarate aldolase